jgi:hypothetical protein
MRLTALEAKLWNALLSNAQEKISRGSPDDSRAAFSASQEDIEPFLGRQPSARIRAALRTLSEKDILVDGVAAPPLSSRETTLGRTISYEFSPHIQPHLTPRVYGRLSPAYLAATRSRHAIHLYEFAALYVNRRNPTWEIDIDDFVAQMGLSEAYRRRPDNIRVRIIDPAISEINTFSPLLAAYEMLPAAQKRPKPMLRFFFDHAHAHRINTAPAANEAPIAIRHRPCFASTDQASAQAILQHQKSPQSFNAKLVEWQLWLSSLPQEVRHRLQGHFLPWLSLNLADQKQDDLFDFPNYLAALKPAPQDIGSQHIGSQHIGSQHIGSQRVDVPAVDVSGVETAAVGTPTPGTPTPGTPAPGTPAPGVLNLEAPLPGMPISTRIETSRCQLKARRPRPLFVAQPREETIQLVALSLGRPEKYIRTWADQWQWEAMWGRDPILRVAAQNNSDDSFVTWVARKMVTRIGGGRKNKGAERILENEIGAAKRAMGEGDAKRAVLAGLFLLSASQNAREIEGALRDLLTAPRGEGGKNEGWTAGDIWAFDHEDGEREAWLDIARRRWGMLVSNTPLATVIDVAKRLAEAERARQSRQLRNSIIDEMPGGRLALLPSTLAFAASRGIDSDAILAAERKLLSDPVREMSDMPGHLSSRAVFLLALSRDADGESLPVVDDKTRADLFWTYVQGSPNATSRLKHGFATWVSEIAYGQKKYPIDCEIDFALWRQRQKQPPRQARAALA